MIVTVYSEGPGICSALLIKTSVSDGTTAFENLPPPCFGNGGAG